MLSSWNRLVTKAGSNLATRSRTKRANVSNSRASSRSIQTSTAAAISTDVSNWSYLAIAGVGLAASAVFWTKTRKGVAAEEEEPFVVKAPAVLSNLKKDRAYIVGEAVLTGKNDSDPMLVPHEIASDVAPLAVSIGDKEGWYIGQGGQLFTWTRTKKISPILPRERFTQVETGQDGFVAALSTNGKVWIRFAENEEFKCIPNDRKGIIKISVGAKHCVALSADNAVFVLGSNDHGQCGNQELASSPHDKPKRIDWPQKVTDIAAGKFHTALVTIDGNVVTFGFNKNLQLGKPQEWVKYQTPSIPMVPFGGYHEVRDSEQARFNSRNWNDTNEYITQYAHSNPSSVDFFTINNIKASKVVCGDEFTLVFDDTGAMYAFGDGSRGQLGRKPARTYVPPTRVLREPFTEAEAKNIKSVSCGSAHCIALTNAGDLWSWGWNLQGSCARQNKVLTLTPTKIPIDPSCPPIRKVFCTQNASVVVL